MSANHDDTCHAIEPQVPAVIIIGIVCYFSPRTIGSGSYSPGLEFDANLYTAQFLGFNHKNSAAANSVQFQVEYISPWQTDEKSKLETQRIINSCTAIIGLEELGTQDNLDLMRRAKAREESKLRLILWIPNLEVTETRHNAKWSYTLNNLDLIDYIVAKTTENSKESFEPLINQLYEPVRKINSAILMPKVIYIPHATPAPPPISKFPHFYSPDFRRNILHFAGSSPHKNTLNQVKAGVALVAKYPQFYAKLIVKISQWPKEKFALGHNIISELKELAVQNPKVELRLGGFISDEEKFELFASSRLSLCCSTAEGFGHYIYESFAMGCTVVTTAGFPMEQAALFCSEEKAKAKEGSDAKEGSAGSQEARIVALVKPERTQLQNLGLGHTVSSSSIVEAVEQNLHGEYTEAVIRRCVERYDKQTQLFESAICSILIPLIVASKDSVKACNTVLSQGVQYPQNHDSDKRSRSNNYSNIDNNNRNYTQTNRDSNSYNSNYSSNRHDSYKRPRSRY
jgi:hypothetical protein